MKIIGCGNKDRGDDQAGLVVAERLRELGLHAEAHTGDALGLLEHWHCHDEVILIDAVTTGARPGTLHIWEYGDSGYGLPLTDDPTAVSSHGFDIANAIELGRALGRLPQRLRIYGIEGREFQRGAACSPPILGAIQEAVRRIQAEVLPI